MPSSTTEETKTVIRRQFDAFNDCNREKFIECFSADASPYGLDFDEFVETEFSFFEAFPDLQRVVKDLFAENDLGAVRWTFTGTHENRGGPDWLSDTAPTYEEVKIPGVDVIRVRNGKIVEYNGEWDYGRLLEQLGLISLPFE